MCLAIPARVERIDGVDALVDVGGIRKTISLALVEGVTVGDYVLLHVGYAISTIDPVEAEKTLALFSEALGAEGMGTETQGAETLGSAGNGENVR